MNRHRPSGKEFKDLATKVNNVLIDNEGLIGDQQAQVELLFELEKKFKYNIQKYQQCVTIYHKFIYFIGTETGNILSAGPYFREKKDVFSREIAGAIRDDNAEILMKFDINFQLIDFIVKNWKGNLPVRAARYYREFLEARRILIENNLPLAINRAKKFYKNTPRSHLSLLDFIDICTYGLIGGVDKYVGAYKKVWRSVCIGHMVGYMIKEYSKTFIRMYPTDKKILYRANALRFRLKIEDTIELTKAVNESFENDKKEGKAIPTLPILEVHVRTLLNGSGYVSADSKNDSETGDGASIYDYAADQTPSAEEKLIKEDLMVKILSASKDLSVVEKKIIQLKGVEI